MLRISAYALSAVLFLGLAHITVAADDISAAIPNPESVRGVVVIAGIDDADAIVKFAKAAPVVVLFVAKNEQDKRTFENTFRAAGVYGQVSVVTLDHRGRIPLTDRSASVLIANRRNLPQLTAGEMNRIVRPFGTIHYKQGGEWSRSVQPRPAGMDDWAAYDKDAAASQHSLDTLVGKPRGLQWVAGPTNKQSYTLLKNETALTIHQPVRGDHQSESLMARDAFSGLPLWEREDIAPRNRFAVVVGERHIVLHSHLRRIVAPYTVALDRHTGKTVVTYREGIDCSVTKEQAKADRRAYSRQAERTADLQLRLIDGLLIQIIREEIVALDETTGKRVWSRKAAQDLGFVHPVCGNGRLVVVEGRFQRHSSYTHWPMAKPERILALSLKDGSVQWKLEWDEERFGKAHAVYNLQLEGERLGGAVTIIPEPIKGRIQKPRPHGLILNANSGDVVYWGREEVSPENRSRNAWPGTTGAGHSHVRLHLRGDTVWTAAIGSPIAFWPIDQPKKFTSFAMLYARKGQPPNLRPVSCTVWRSTPNWWFGGLGCYPASGGGEGYFNRSGRSNCDIGAFPANGMLYSPPNTCQCQPYLPGTKAYHSRLVGEEVPTEERLLRGTVKPAPPRDDPDSWPQWRQSPARRAWNNNEYPKDPKPVWNWKAESRDVPSSIASQWSTDGIIFGPLTQSSCAEGILVVAIAHRHEVIGIDPESGGVRWRTPVDGRVDMSPSIYNGLVLLGTRNGFVYALNRDTGELIWRFFAAPRHDRIAVNGQLESPWPVFGAIPVDDDGLIAIAGRHSSNDGGLWWWQLDPATGKILARGRVDEQEASKYAANQPSKLPIELRPLQNSVAVMTDQWFCLPGNVLRRTKGRLGVPEDNGRFTEKSYIEANKFLPEQHKSQIIRMGRNSLVGERAVTVGGWRKPFYANTLARMFAIDVAQKRFVSVGGGVRTASGRGGGGDSTVHLMQILGEPVSERRGKRYVEQSWEYKDWTIQSRGLPSVTSLAVARNAIYLGMSVYGTDRKARDAQAEMPHRLRVLSLDTGEFIRDIPVPGRVLQGGIALAGGRIFVTTEDGSVTAFSK